MFFCEYCEIFMKTYFEEHSLTAASDGKLVERLINVTEAVAEKIMIIIKRYIPDLFFYWI